MIIILVFLAKDMILPVNQEFEESLEWKHNQAIEWGWRTD